MQDKGTVKWKQKWVETGINWSILISYLAGKCPFLAPNGHHHERSINVFSDIEENINIAFASLRFDTLAITAPHYSKSSGAFSVPEYQIIDSWDRILLIFFVPLIVEELILCFVFDSLGTIKFVFLSPLDSWRTHALVFLHSFDGWGTNTLVCLRSFDSLGTKICFS